ncbi:MAG: hypothetical protein QNK04_09890 [Myxococcota bacterium]|nr:hypothetical protein [Myxococcota bacterium]
MDEREGLVAEQRVADESTPGRVDEPAGLDVGLLAVLLAILGLVAASNVWLRRRAERENAASEVDDEAGPGA